MVMQEEVWIELLALERATRELLAEIVKWDRQ